MARLGAAPLHDPLAVAHVVEPGIVATRPARCRVELAPGDEYGRTVYELDADRPDLHVGLNADTGALLRLLVAALG